MDDADRPPPGLLPGAALGVVAGLVLASTWLFGEWDVALAVTFVFAGLVAVLLASQGWRPFVTGLLAFAGVAGGVLVALAWFVG